MSWILWLLYLIGKCAKSILHIWAVYSQFYMCISTSCNLNQHWVSVKSFFFSKDLYITPRRYWYRWYIVVGARVRSTGLGYSYILLVPWKWIFPIHYGKFHLSSSLKGCCLGLKSVCPFIDYFWNIIFKVDKMRSNF